MSLINSLGSRLQDKKRAGLYRTLKVTEQPTGIHRVVNGQQVVSFCSNDYLGLASDPRVIETFCKAAERCGVGTGAAALINGRTAEHDELERKLANFTQRDRALLFSSGYMANLGVAMTLAKRKSNILEDRLNHASLLDAAQLAQARLQRYPHLDNESVARLLTQTPDALVMTDALFSMDGDRADLPALAKLCRNHDATLVADDAHGFGVLGDNGGGSLEDFQLTQNDVPVLVGTLGKACGTFGAFVAGSETLIESLIQEARTYIYTTAPPAALAAATLTSLALIAEEPERREALQKNVALFKQCMRDADLPQSDSQTAIQPMIVGDADRAQTLSQTLFENGIHITAIRPPTVPAGTSRLRVTLSAQHCPEDIHKLVGLLAECLPVVLYINHR